MGNFILGICAGITTLSLLITFIPSSPRNVIEKAITDCEKNLPRNQSCVIIAIPKDQK